MSAVRFRSSRARRGMVLALVVGLLVTMIGVRPLGAAAGDTYTISDVSLSEGNSGTTSFTFTVTRTAGTGPSSVGYATRPGSATAGTDYTTTNGNLAFVANGSQTVTVPVIGDIGTELDETFFLDLALSSGGTCQPDCTGQGTILNDDGDPPAIVISNVTQLEGNSGTSNFVFNVDLTEPSNQPVTVAYATENSTASAADSDFVGASGTLTFAPGVTRQTVSVQVVGDTKDESNETFFVNLSAATNATLADAQGEGRIDNDDVAPAVSVGDLTVDESTGTANVPVSLSAASGRTVTVTYTTSDGTATAGTDYTAVSGTVTFAPGETAKNAPVSVVNDAFDEPDETFTVTLSAPTNATLGDPTGTVTITDNDAAPSLAVNDVVVTEGDGGSTSAIFTVTLSAASGKTVTVDYATSDGSATAGQDYTTTSGTLVFEAGDTSETITVPVNADLRDEPTPETFTVNLTNASNASITDAQGTGTINDDDAVPTLSVNDAVVTEGNTGTTVTATFTVSLSAASNNTITVNYATSNGTATAPADYTAKSGALTFAPGETSKPITVTVTGDDISELDETFAVTLSTPTNATIADGAGQGTILNDDAGPNITVGDTSVLEGDSGTVSALFTVTLSAPSAQPITVQYNTADGTATSPEDYTESAGTVTFSPGQTTKSIAVTVRGDTVPEAGEQFTVHLSSPTGDATITDADGTGTITNDDGTPPSVAISDVTQDEGNSGTTAFVFTVTRTGPTGATSTVDYQTAAGSATTPSDFASTSGTLTFGPGVTAQTVTVQVVGDTTVEPSETFTVELSNPRNTVIGDAQGIGTITNDDAIPVISISDVTAGEGSAGTTPFTFTINLSNASTSPVTVDVSTVAGGTAQANDFTSLPTTTVTFAPGETAKTVTVDVIGDSVDEANETFFVDLAAPTNATIGDGRGVGTITDDDVAPVVSINDVGVNEGDAGTTNAVFTITLSTASGQTVTVDVSTVAGGTAQANDFTALPTTTVTFAPGEIAKTVTVQVTGDPVDEANETFFLDLAAPANATIGDGRGVGTINDDDAAGSLYTAIAPTRLLDTRNGTGGPSTPFGPGETRDLVVTGGPVPIDVTAVVVNVTATDPTAAGFLTVYPAGVARPLASNLNFVAGDTIPNLVTVGVGQGESAGKISIFNSAGTVNVIGDIVGYYRSGSGSSYTAVTPTRLLDSRNGTGGPASPWGPGETRELTVTGGAVPIDATAVVVNVTATQPTANSYLTVYPGGLPRPLASNLNFSPDETIPNLVVVGVGTDLSAGKVVIYNDAGSVHVIADVVGYYRPVATEGRFTALTPTRVLDTRESSPLGAQESGNLTVRGEGTPLPDDATAVVLNVTATQPTANSFLTVFPADVSRPLASNLNFAPGQTIPNLVIVGIGDSGPWVDQVTFYNSAGTVHVIADVVGYMS